MVLPPTVPASLLYMLENGIYLVNNGRVLALWLGRGVDPHLAVQVSKLELNELSGRCV